MTPSEVSAFFALVKQRPLNERAYDYPHCYVCNHGNATAGHYGMTLVGGRANHYHQLITCSRGCKSWREWKEHGERAPENVWYTAAGHVIAGVPSCFESYSYDCASCGQHVLRELVEKATGKPTHIDGGRMVDGAWVSLSRTRYFCVGCAAACVIENAEHWIPADGMEIQP